MLNYVKLFKVSEHSFANEFLPEHKELFDINANVRTRFKPTKKTKVKIITFGRHPTKLITALELDTCSWHIVVHAITEVDAYEFENELYIRQALFYKVFAS